MPAAWPTSLARLGLLRQHGVKPDVVDVTQALAGCGGNAWPVALSALREVAIFRLQTDVVFFGAQFCALRSAWMMAQALLVVLEASGIFVNTLALNALLAALGQRAWSAAAKLLMEEQVLRNVISFSTLVTACGDADEWWRALRLFSQVPQSRLQSNLVIFNAAATAAASGADWRGATIRLRDLQIPADIITYNATLSSYEPKEWPRALQFLAALRCHRHLKGNAVSYNACINICEKSARWEQGLWLFKRSPQPLNADLAGANAAASACGRGSCWQLTRLLFERLATKLCKTDQISRHVNISACERSGQWQQALWLHVWQHQDSLRASAVSYNATISACETAGSWHQALALLGQMEEAVEADVVTFGSLVSSVGRAAQWQQTVGWLRAAQIPGRDATLILGAAMSRTAQASQWQHTMVLLEEVGADPDVAAVEAQGDAEKQQRSHAEDNGEDEDMDEHECAVVDISHQSVRIEKQAGGDAAFAIHILVQLRVATRRIRRLRSEGAVCPVVRPPPRAGNPKRGKLAALSPQAVSKAQIQGPSQGQGCLLQELEEEERDLCGLSALLGNTLTVDGEPKSVHSRKRMHEEAFDLLNLEDRQTDNWPLTLLLFEVFAASALSHRRVTLGVGETVGVIALNVAVGAAGVGSLWRLALGLIEEYQIAGLHPTGITFNAAPGPEDSGAMGALAKLGLDTQMRRQAVERTVVSSLPAIGYGTAINAVATQGAWHLALHLLSDFELHAMPPVAQLYVTAIGHAEILAAGFQLGFDAGTRHLAAGQMFHGVGAGVFGQAPYRPETLAGPLRPARETVSADGWGNGFRQDLEIKARETVSADGWGNGFRQDLEINEKDKCWAVGVAQNCYKVDWPIHGRTLMGLGGGREPVIGYDLTRTLSPASLSSLGGMSDVTVAAPVTAPGVEVPVATTMTAPGVEVPVATMMTAPGVEVPVPVATTMTAPGVEVPVATTMVRWWSACLSALVPASGRGAQELLAEVGREGLRIVADEPGIPWCLRVALWMSWAEQGKPRPLQLSQLSRNADMSSNLVNAEPANSGRVRLRSATALQPRHRKDAVAQLNAEITAASRGKNWRQALRLFQGFEARSLRADGISYTADMVVYTAAIAAAEKAHHWQMALCLLEQMLQRQLGLDVYTCSAAISACEAQGRWREAVLLLSSMRSWRSQPNVVSFSAALSACEKAGKWALAFEILEEMQESSVAPNTITYNAVLSAIEKSGQWELAFQLLFDIPEPSAISFTAALAACESQSAWESALWLLSTRMPESRIAPSVLSYAAVEVCCEDSYCPRQVAELLSEVRATAAETLFRAWS
ncbi:unnamed protein product [Symbiodinium sp. CCMP2592]|nr:unnamed protein product [Symbiodinium sp. CCMP2592]